MADTYRGASREALERLHAAFVDVLVREFENGNNTAAFLHVVRGFLKDNHCHADMASAADLQRSLQELRSLGLPFIDPNKEPK